MRIPKTWRVRRSFRLLHDQQGASLIEVALLVPVLLLLFIGAIDFGRAYSASIAVNSAAEAGALYGVQNSSDIAGMVLAAKLDGANLVALVPIATYGCECSDGTSGSVLCVKQPTCSSNVVNYVDVTATEVYKPLLSYPGLPKLITLTSRARMRTSQ